MTGSTTQYLLTEWRMNTTVKTCFKCSVEKPITDFYVHPQMGDGRLNKCKECTKRDVQKNYQDNIDYYREYDRQRFRDSPKRQRQLRGLFETRTTRQKKAHNMLSNAIRDGKVAKAEACWCCGSTRNIEGHHVHYDMPLDVVWLCRSCHCKAHRQTTLGESCAA